MELMIAMTVFTILLMICLVTFLQIGRVFSKGVNMTLVQEDARNITSSITSDIQFYNKPFTPVVITSTDHQTKYFCIGNHEYKFLLGAHVGYGAAFGLKRTDISGSCPDPAGDTSGAEMAGNSMQLNNLTVSCPNGLCTVTINLVFYGVDNTVFESPSGSTPAYKAADAQCTGALAGSQYCATANYSSTVLESY